MKNKRTFRNVMMVLMIVALCAATFFTMLGAKNDLASQSSQMQSSMSSQSTPPDKPGDNSQGSSDSQGQDNANSQSSATQSNSDSTGNVSDNNSNTVQNQAPPSGDAQNSSNSQPPQKPDDASSNNDTGSSNNSAGTQLQQTSTDTQSSDSSQGGSVQGNSAQAPGSMGAPSGGPGGDMQGEQGTKTLSSAYYALFAIEGLGISFLVMYLVMSKFNKKTVRQTFKSFDKVLIFSLASVIITSGLTFADAQVTEKYFLTNSQSQSQSSSQTSQASGATTVDGKSQTLSDSYSSSTSDESAILVSSSGEATIDGAKITKSGDSSNTENSEFYGVNAAVLVQENSTATIKNAEITTKSKGANAVFSTGENSKIYISDSTVTSTGSGSARGLDATYGGYIEADNVTVTTSGASCAALATDRGEGTVIAKNSNLTTNGAGSPVIYSTGDITVSNTKGYANGSQAVVVEGKNSATVEKSSLVTSAAGNRNNVDNAGVFIYQSMSGDAGEGTGTFTSKNSSITISESSDYYKTAPMFFVTNTDAVINLENTALSYGSGVLLNAAATDEWGNSGSNGGNVELNATNQTLKGNIVADKISTVAISFEKSQYTGTINGSNTAKSVTLKLDSSSKITLTGDSYVTSLDDAVSDYSNIDFNGYTLYVNGTAING